MEKDDTCVIEIVIFYCHIPNYPMKVVMVLNSVVSSVIDNYACIDYLGCQYKNLSVICSDEIFAHSIYN